MSVRDEEVPLERRNSSAPGAHGEAAEAASPPAIAPGKLDLAQGAALVGVIAISPGKVSRAAVQMLEIGERRPPPDELAAIAGAGVAGSSGAPLPHLETIQSAFGRHDVSGVRAHVGGAAAEACAEVGALAYATGADVAFAGDPDLHTAAHEAAHVVQQSGGVQLAGGVGEAGDRYERHADAVADAVVAGRSAEALLDQMAGGGGAAGRRLQLRIDDRIGRYVYEGGRWRRADGSPSGPADERRIRRLLVERARTNPRLPRRFQRAYLTRLQGGGPPLPEVVWFREHGRRLARTDEEHRQVMNAITRRGGDSDDIAGQSPGEPIRGRNDPSGLEVRSLDSTPESTRLPLEETDQDAANVRMDDAVAADDDQVLHSGGFHACTGFSTVVNQPDGTRREVAHVAAGHREGAYPQLVDSLARNIPAGGGTIDTYVNTHPETRTQPDHEDATPMPANHTELMRSLQGDLQSRLGSDYQVRQDGNALVVTNPQGRQTRINVGVDERPTDSGPTRITQGQGGVRVQTGDNPPDLLDHETAARLGHDEPAQRAERIRWILQERIASDPEGDGAARAREHLAALDAGEPTAEHVDRVARQAGISDEEIHRAQPPRGEGQGGAPEGRDAVRVLPVRHVGDEGQGDGGGGGGEGQGEGGEPAVRVVPPPENVVDPDTRDRTHRLRSRLQEQARSDDPESARRARRALDQLGSHPDAERVRRASETAGIDPDSLDDPEVPQQRRQRTGRTASVSPDGTVAVNEENDDGSGRSLSAQADQHGGQLEASRTSEDGTESRVGVQYHEQRNSRGEVVGRDLGVSGGRGPISGTLSGGYTYDLSEPREQDDGSFQVQWTVGARGRAEGQVSGGPVGGGRGGALHATRTGTQVFTGGTREENLARAERWRDNFEGIGMQLYRAASLDLNDIDFWREAPAGTSRQVEVGGELSRSASASILRFLSIGAGASVTAAGSAKVEKKDQGHVEVTQTWTVGGGVNVSGGNLVGVEGGHEESRRVSEKFLVDLGAGEAAFERFLGHSGFLEEGQQGVTLRQRVEEDTSTDTSGANVAILGGIQGRESTSEEVETLYDEDGNVVGTRTVHHGRQEMTGNTVMGDYTRRRFRVDAPESGRPYVIYEDLQSSEGGESAQMLGDATGNRRANSRAQSSGNWVVAEQLSQEEARTFHVNLMQRYPADGDGPPLGDPMRGVWSELRADPEGENGALRARVLADFLSENGRDGVRMIRGVSGSGPGTQYFRHYQEGDETRVAVPGQDEQVAVFLGEQRSRQLTSWLQQHEGEEALDPATLAEARRKLAQMDARIGYIEDVDHFTDMPPEMRRSILARYHGYRDRLARLADRAGDEAAEDFSQEGQAHHDEVRRAEQDADSWRTRADVFRHRVQEARRRYGQESSERRQQAQLGPEIRSRTESMWSSAETAYQEGERALAEGRERLRGDAQEGADELASRTGYRSAEASFEEARAAFERARDEMRELDRIYERADQYREGELDESDSDSDSDSDADSRNRRRRRRRPERQRRQRRPRAEHPDREQAEDGAGEGGGSSGRELLSAPPQLVGRHIHPTANGDGVDIDQTPFRLPNGLTVQLTISPAPPMRLDSPRVEQMFGGTNEVYLARLVIVEPLAGGVRRFEGRVVDSSGRVHTFQVSNSENETFPANGTRVMSVS